MCLCNIPRCIVILHVILMILGVGVIAMTIPRHIAIGDDIAYTQRGMCNEPILRLIGSHFHGLTIATALFSIIASTLGLINICCDSTVKLLLYAVLLSLTVLLCLEVALLCELCKLSNTQMSDVEDYMEQDMLDYEKDADTASIWNELQMEVKCCGSTGPRSWQLAKMVAPRSCCVDRDKSCDYSHNVHKRGCARQVMVFLRIYTPMLLTVVILMTIFTFDIAVSPCLLFATMIEERHRPQQGQQQQQQQQQLQWQQQQQQQRPPYRLRFNEPPPPDYEVVHIEPGRTESAYEK